MQMTKVASMTISSVGYENETLYIQFPNGQVFAYLNVPERVYNNLMCAPSHGKYFSSVVKGTYDFKRLK